MPPPVPKALQKDDEGVFSCTVNGELVTVDLKMFSGSEQRLWRRTMRTECLDGPEETIADVDRLDAMLGYLWLRLRRDTPEITFDEVSDSVTMGDLIAAIDAGEDSRDEADPEG